jgi:hypothetical protein
MMDDPFDNEAIDGLGQLSGDELESDMDLLSRRLEMRTAKSKKIRMVPILKIAATLIILFGIGAFLYFMLKTPETELLTQQLNDQKKQHVPETAVPGLNDQAEKNMSPDSLALSQPDKTEKVSRQMSHSDSNALDEIVSYQTIETEQKDVPVEIRSNSEALETSSAAPEKNDSLGPAYITGRVLGVNRLALEGVMVKEEGTARGTLTDDDGRFRLRVRDQRSNIELSYTGYKNMEVSSKEVSARKEIMLDEELLARSEVIVLKNEVPFSQKKSASRVNTSEPISERNSVNVYNRPIPPGGSMKNFETWVESRIDTVHLKELLPGNYKIRVKLTVYKDGTIGEISAPADIPEIVATEYVNAVSLSELWTPAMQDNLPVDTDIMIEFSLTVK